MTTFLSDGNVLGHRQITDAYLVTLDRGIAALHADVE
jgi:hypothetical protein